MKQNLLHSPKKSISLLVCICVVMCLMGYWASAQETSDSSKNKPSQHQLSIGDTVKIVVFQEEDLTTEVTIPPSGKIMVPLLEEVPVAGLTLVQAAERIQKGLGKDYLVNPKVSMFLVSFAKKEVTVMGAVKTPGQIQFPENNTLNIIQAIGMAGGFNENANRSKVVLHRKGKKGLEKLTIPLKSEFALQPLQPKDSITVLMSSSNERLTIIGEVKQPGTINVAPEQMPIDLLSAVALAGGFTDLADLGQVLLKRTENNKNQILKLDAKSMLEKPTAKAFFLKAGDIVTVQQRKKEFVTVLGQVNEPGNVEILNESGTPLDILGAVAMAGGFTRIADSGKVQLRRTLPNGKIRVYKINAKKLINNSEMKPIVLQPGDVISVPESMF